MPHKLFLQKFKNHKRLILVVCVSIIFIATIFLPITQTFAKIDESTLRFYAKNNILYYDPTGKSANCLPGYGTASLVEGNTQVEVAWNYLVSANIPGISNNAAAIAGIVGNLRGESEVDPFVSNGTYHGVFQATSSGIISDVNNHIPGAASLWHGGYGKTYPEGSTELELAKQAIPIEMDYFTSQNGKTSEYTATFQKMVNDINRITNKTPESYAEMFLVYIERAVYSDVCSGNHSEVGTPGYLQDPDVIDLQREFYTTYWHRPVCVGVPYQGVEARRKLAREIYEKFTSDTPTAIAEDPDSPSSTSDGSNVTFIGDSITYGVYKLSSSFSSTFPNAEVSAETSRPFSAGIDIINNPSDISSYHYGQYSSSENTSPTTLDLRQNVVFALGTNSSNLTEENIRNVIENPNLAGKRIFFLTNWTTSSDYANNNNLFKKFAAEKNNVYLIDWAAAVKNNPSKYLSDGTHPTTEGADLWVKLISDAIGNPSSLSFDPCGDSTSLTPGGMTLDEAKKYMENTYLAFTDQTGYDWNTNIYGINKTNCSGGSFYNCVAYVQYFIAVNTGTAPGGLPNGGQVVQTLIDRGIATDLGHTPEVYAVFSRHSNRGSAAGGHTGIVLGITDTDIIVGQAGCNEGRNGIKAKTIPLSEATSDDYNYARLNNLKIGN